MELIYDDDSGPNPGGHGPDVVVLALTAANAPEALADYQSHPLPAGMATRPPAQMNDDVRREHLLPALLAAGGEGVEGVSVQRLADSAAGVAFRTAFVAATGQQPQMAASFLHDAIVSQALAIAWASHNGSTDPALVAANFPNVNDPGGRVIRPRPADYATATRRIAQDLLINYEGGGSSVDPYWDNPALFNRDRPLFRKYVPLIRRINREGWQVVTQARSADPTVFIERFGSWPSLFFTLRNSGDRAVTTRISFDAALGLPAGRLVARPLIAGGPELVAGEGAGRPLPVTLAPQQVELLEIAQ